MGNVIAYDSWISAIKERVQRARYKALMMRQFADAWRRDEIVQAPLGQLPWYHHIALLEQLKSRGDACMMTLTFRQNRDLKKRIDF